MLASLGQMALLFLSHQELLIVLVIVLIIFGGSKIPQLARGLGEGIREFRKASREPESEESASAKTESVAEQQRS